MKATTRLEIQLDMAKAIRRAVHKRIAKIDADDHKIEAIDIAIEELSDIRGEIQSDE